MTRQLSVFVENKPGKVSRITSILARHDINLRAMTISDSGHFGVLHILTNSPEKAYRALKKEGLLVSFREVVIVEIPDEVGAFHRLAELLEKKGINIEDASGFTAEKRCRAVIILKVANPQMVEKFLIRSGYETV